MSTQTSKLPNTVDKTKITASQLFSNAIFNASSPQEVQKIWLDRRQFNLKLIEQYKKEECLWNVNTVSFLFSLSRKPAWERIAAKMGDDVTVDLVKKRIFTMRCQMQDEAAKAKYTKSVAVPNSKYYFAKHFAFLDEMMANRKILGDKKLLTSTKSKSKTELQLSKPKTLKKQKSVLDIASTSMLISNALASTALVATKSKGKISPRSSAGRVTSVSNASASKALVSKKSKEKISPRSSAGRVTSVSNASASKALVSKKSKGKISPRSSAGRVTTVSNASASKALVSKKSKEKISPKSSAGRVTSVSNASASKALVSKKSKLKISPRSSAGRVTSVSNALVSKNCKLKIPSRSSAGRVTTVGNALAWKALVSKNCKLKIPPRSSAGRVTTVGNASASKALVSKKSKGNISPRSSAGRVTTVSNASASKALVSKKSKGNISPRSSAGRVTSVSNASASTALVSKKSKGKVSTRSSALRVTSVNNVSASTALGLKKSKRKISRRSNASAVSIESGEELSSSSISSLHSHTSSVKKLPLIKPSTLSSIYRRSSKTLKGSSSYSTWYTPTISSTSYQTPVNGMSSELKKGYPWSPLKFKNTSPLLKSSFKVRFKRAANYVPMKKLPKKSSTKKSIQPKKEEPLNLDSSLSDNITTDLERNVRLEIEQQRQENRLNFPSFSNPKIMTIGEKIEEDDQKFFNKLFETCEEIKPKNEKKRVESVAFYRLEHYFKSINSPATNIVKNLNQQHSKQMRADMLTRGIYPNQE